jgi:nucleoside 2-deoxyribosyltransferase
LKIFIICPVRNMTADERIALEAYIHKLESQGNTVHFPPRDTNQNDPTGWNIIAQNRAAIEGCDEVHIFWNKDSQGSMFDLGMAFAFRKPVTLINTVEPTPTKSFENVLLKWAKKE